MLIVDELSRLGRSVSQILHLLESLQHVEVHILKQGLVLSKDSSNWQSALLVHIFAVVAQLERDLLSERTKCGLLEARRKKVLFGRPKKSYCLKEHENEIQELLEEKASISFIARRFKVARSTVYNYLNYLEETKKG